MYDVPVSPCSSTDDGSSDFRVSPEWSRYGPIIERRGYRLETVRDVRAFYERLAAQGCQGLPSQHVSVPQHWIGYPQNAEDENDLCKDRGLVSLHDT